MGTNESVVASPNNCLVIDILCSEFGHDKVNQALKYKNHYRDFKKANHNLVSESFSTLSHQWQMGRLREYLESLAVEVQYSLICYLAENYINDKSRADTLFSEHNN